MYCGLKIISFGDSTAHGDHEHRDEKIREHECPKRNHRVKIEGGQNVAVKQRVKTACQTASRTSNAGHLKKRADGEKSGGRGIEKPDKSRAADGC